MRRGEFDWARNAIVFTLPLFHSARVFDSFDTFYVKSATTLVAADAVILALGTWSMPLLFAVAGAASWFALSRRGGRQYCAERLRRLGLPFVFGVIVIVPPQSYVAALSHGWRGSYLGYWFGPFFTQWGDPSGYAGGFTIAHLWFLAVLLAIAIVLAPLLPVLRRAAPGSRVGRVFAQLRRPGAYATCALALTALELVPAIGEKNLAVCAGYFLLGFAALPSGDFLAWATRWRWPLIAAGALLLAVAWWALNAWGFPEGVSAPSAAISIARHLATLALIAGVLGAFASPRMAPAALPWLNAACMPYYVVHQTVLVLVAGWLLTWVDSAPVAFVLLLLASSAASLALAAVIVRVRVLGPLFGLKPRPRTEPAHQ